MKYTKISANKLYQPIIRYKKNKLIVTSIGMIHIGEPEYYEKVQKIIDNIEFGFFERIGHIEDMETIPENKRESAEKLNNLSYIYLELAEYLLLRVQYLEYGESWKKSDTTLTELVKETPEPVLKDIAPFIDPAFMKAYESSPEEFTKAFKGIAFFAYKHIKKIHFLKHLRSRSVKKFLIDNRNKILFNDLETKFEENYKGEIGIVYGYGHSKGINKFLTKKGFKKTEVGWLPAWTTDERPCLWNYLKHNQKLTQLMEPFMGDDERRKKLQIYF